MIKTLELDGEYQRLLSLSPESGMGYHYFEYNDPEKPITSIEQKESFVVSNSQAVYYSARDFPVSVFWNNDSFKVENFERDDIQEIRNAILGISKELKLINKYGIDKNPSGPKPSELPPPPFLYTTRQGDEFRRLSAFREDNRIFKDGALRHGSYGTTILDLNLANSGVAAVGRYALPNRLAACYVFQIIPPPGTNVLFGTVTPNFGLCGGGVEVYFPEGCAAGSVRLMRTIPEF